MSEPGEPDSESNERIFDIDDDAVYAAMAYVIAYNIGTIVWGFAEPTSGGLLPAFYTGVAIWLVKKTGRVAEKALGCVTILFPIVVAAVVVAIQR